MIDYWHKVTQLQEQRVKPLYDEPNDIRLETHFWHPFHFDFYHHVVFLKYTKKNEPLVI